MTEMIVDWSGFPAPWHTLGPQMAADLKVAVASDGILPPPPLCQPKRGTGDPLIEAFKERAGASKVRLARDVGVSYSSVKRWFKVGRVSPSRRAAVRRWLTQ